MRLSRSHNRHRRVLLGLLFLAFVAWTSQTLIVSSSVSAQDDPAPAAGDNGDAAPATTSSDPPPSYLSWAFEALGWGYSLIFLLLSFTLVALIVMNLLTARR